MKIIIEGINFKFNNGYNESYTGIGINYRTVNSMYRIQGEYDIDSETYEREGIMNLMPLLKSRLISELNTLKNVTASSIDFNYPSDNNIDFDTVNINIYSIVNQEVSDITYNINGYMVVDGEEYKDVINEGSIIRDFIIDKIIDDVNIAQ